MASKMMAPTSDTMTEPNEKPSLMVPVPTKGEISHPPMKAPMMPTITFSRMPCCPSVLMMRLASQPTMPPTINQSMKLMRDSFAASGVVEKVEASRAYCHLDLPYEILLQHAYDVKSNA
jgi:hypothetical protein